MAYRQPLRDGTWPRPGRWIPQLIAILCVAVTLLLTACSGDPDTASKDLDGDEAIDEANIKKGVKPQPDEQVAVLETDYGTIVIELYPNIAPQMVERFKKLIGEGFYNGTTFHRIDPDLGIIQGGDPLSRDADPRNDGTGGSNYPDLPAEFSDVPYERGIVGAARSASPDSANSQFYITLKRVPNFDQRYTVFGRVTSGMDVADSISELPRDARDRPREDVAIERVELAE